MRNFIRVMIQLVIGASLAGNLHAQRKNVVVYVGDKLQPDTTVNTFIKDTLIDSFIGKWTWQSRDSALVFRFRKLNVKMGSDEKQLEVEMLAGGFLSTKDGIPIVLGNLRFTTDQGKFAR